MQGVPRLPGPTPTRIHQTDDRFNDASQTNKRLSFSRYVKPFGVSDSAAQASEKESRLIDSILGPSPSTTHSKRTSYNSHTVGKENDSRFYSKDNYISNSSTHPRFYTIKEELDEGSSNSGGGNSSS